MELAFSVSQLRESTFCIFEETSFASKHNMSDRDGHLYIFHKLTPALKEQLQLKHSGSLNFFCLDAALTCGTLGNAAGAKAVL